MKILHFADLHLGIDNYGSPDARTGLSTRVGDFLAAFDRIIERAIDEQVDAVLFAGDAFKNRDPNPTLQREFGRRISRLAKAEIPIVLLVGNHDLPGTTSRATATDIYTVLEIPNVIVSRQIELLRIPTRSGPLQVVTVPWVARSLMLAVDLYRGVADDELDLQIAQAISDQLRQYVTQLDPAEPAVLLGHLSVQGAEFGHERSIMLGRDVTVGTDDLHVETFDYVALGHIHRHQRVREFPPVVYAGSPERVDFGEERETKGYVLVQIGSAADGSRRAGWAFEELATRPFYTLRIRANAEEPMAVVRREIDRRQAEITGAVVRAYIEVPAGRESEIALLEVRRLLEAGAAHVARVVVESEAQVRARVDVSDEESLDPAQMLRRWVELRTFDPALRERVLTLGNDLITKHNS
jgi:exonuclease SbcD